MGFQKKGFALIITISMMVLLTLVGLGLLSLSVLTLRTSGHASAQVEARANARLALMVALGELQKYAGADQRVTATADLAGTLEGFRLETGQMPANNVSVENKEKGLSQLRAGTRYWTGVWTDETTADTIYRRTPSPKLLRWLISGSEGTESTATGSAPTPASSVVNLGSNGEVSDPEKAVVLVGDQSLGPAGTDVDQFVVAPLVEVTGEDDNTMGRYAWWVGDEGVKSPLSGAVDYAKGDAAEARDMSSPRRGWESVDGFENYPVPGDPNADKLGRVVSLPEAELLDGSFNGPSSPVKESFHAATPMSRGVLADSLRGGLRIDLTTSLRSLPSTGSKRFANSPASGRNNIIQTRETRRMRGPTWEHLASYLEMDPTSGSGELEVKPTDGTSGPAIAPTIADLRILMGVRIVASGSSGYKLYPCGKLAISLANPYPHPLKWDQALEVEIESITPPGNAPSRIWVGAGQPAFIPRDSREPAVFNRAIFKIPADSLPPGEARAYTMSGRSVRSARDIREHVVDLKAFGDADPSNFDHCIEMEHTSVNTSSKLLDVRESWTTTLVAVNLRSSGSSGQLLLRRIEGLELDNGFFSHVRREVNATTARQLRRPFPMMLFSFQASQPGADYGSVLPSRRLMGTRSSTVRTFTDFNLQAHRFHAPITSYNPPPYFMESSDALSELPFRRPGGDTGSGFTRNLVLDPLPWGRSAFDSERTILFSPNREMVSIAELQHADLTADDVYVSIGHQPGNAVGNSYHTPFVKRDVTTQQRRDYTITGSPNRSEARSVRRNYYDLSYLLNAALWDSYFFSAIPESGTGKPENGAIVLTGSTANLRDPEKAAADLMIEGAFNVNSTSKSAWKALLASSQQLAHPADAAGGASGAFFPRSLKQTDGAVVPPTGVGEDSFSGYRRLSDEELDELAEELTKQVRQRGPFVCLSHFINRAIVDLKTNKEMGRSGALQSAIDESGININTEGDKNGFSEIDENEDRVILQANGNRPRADLDGGDRTAFPDERSEEYPVWPPTSKDDNPGAMASILAERPMLLESDLRNEQGYRSTGIPGWLTQADVLQVIGPSLSARSDTFRIRTYGEAVDQSGKVLARAWCDATVQRIPEYVDARDLATTASDDLNAINRQFGRRFEIVSFRWLSPHEI